MALFSPMAPAGAFACGLSRQETLAFLSNTRTVTDAGEMVVSYAATVSVRGDLQPMGGSYPRYVAGVVQMVDYEFIVIGNPAVVAGNRTEVSGIRLEVVNVNHWGTEHAEILLKELGR